MICLIGRSATRERSSNRSDPFPVDHFQFPANVSRHTFIQHDHVTNQCHQVVGTIAGGAIPVQMMHPGIIDQVPRLRRRRKGAAHPALTSTSCALMETTNS